MSTNIHLHDITDARLAVKVFDEIDGGGYSFATLELALKENGVSHDICAFFRDADAERLQRAAAAFNMVMAENAPPLTLAAE